tara:strand:- start:1348 stop:3084 length:1737 start_codon:yes stop_codon:yes gene_type:complete
MKQYKLTVVDKNYNEYDFLDTKMLKPVFPKLDLNPLDYNLFNQDIIEYDGETCNLLHSSARNSLIPGVLVLERDEKHGSVGRLSNYKYLYKCIPDDRRLPEFLIPYKIKKSFLKKLENRYIIFKFDKWNHNVVKHPLGTCLQNLGPTSNLNSFYEYQLYCKSLYASIRQFNKVTMKKLREKSEEEFIELIKNKYEIEDRTSGVRKDVKIFSIDPSSSKDFDDAFSIWKPDGSQYYIVSIYISNVSFWLDILDLWDSFSNRISTIYLPDRKRPMLPTILSDALCSLTEGDKRFAFTLDLFVDERGEIKLKKFNNTMIKVDKNLRYDTKEQENYEDYKLLFEMVSKMNKVKKYTDTLISSHEIVAYLMIAMNYECAMKLKENETGIFRSSKYNSAYVPPEKIAGDIQNFLKLWNSYGGKYCKYKNIENHDMLELDAYVHATSPIRRLVDLIQSIELQRICNMTPLSDGAYYFYNKWTSDENIDYINKTMRSIRRVQNDCSLLNLCVNNKESLDKVYDGYIFDKIIRNDKLYQYMVYIPEIKMVNRLTSRIDRENYKNYNFKIYIFMDEIRLKQKIRIEII